ncbi:hypothetical protein [Frigidibacter sp. ROC022]|uniref:hypothetical protein n=1 Tax=Frigidibacter sp. ROC022 TaxID=2971796 RepID=UPI00215A7F79|nr:hypothetical protein [Frigidibacter sp. ROC022]MCR8723313.1 hypothetical protein [Frigidibacter sp. ROC022]
MRRPFRSLAAGALLLAAPVLLGTSPAQAQNYSDHDYPGPSFVPSVTFVPTLGLTQYKQNDQDTAAIGNAVYKAVTEAAAFCAALPDETYQIDCLSERLNTIYRSMPSNTPYDETKAALKSAAAQLKAVVDANRDGDKSGKTFATASGDQKTTRRIRPVAPARKAAAVAQAVAIIEETQTVLLRSSATSPEAKPQIERIAAAVGSNKVLLRSA